jgi:hypothetical protein
VKVTFVLLAPAILYALWRNRSGARPVLLGLLGTALVLAPTYLLAGPHVLDQLSTARRFVSLATPWRLVLDGLTGPLSEGVLRTSIQLLWPVVLVLLALLLARLVGLRLTRREPVADTRVTEDAALAAVVLGAAYLFAAPYSLPWYDALAWAPLGLVAGGALDALLLTRLVALAIAYVPGRVVGMSAAVEDLTLGYRRQVAPVDQRGPSGGPVRAVPPAPRAAHFGCESNVSRGLRG